MKPISKHLSLLFVSVLFAGVTAFAQTNTATPPTAMKTYVIERDIPGLGEFTPGKLKTISQTSCSAIRDLGPGIQWLQSYVTDNKMFCIYKAESVELLKEHAKKGGFPINAVYEVSSVISPATAN